MSADLKVFINKSNMLSAKEWRESIQEYGFDIDFDITIDLFGLQGFLPCKFEGIEAGFECYCEPLEDTMFSAADSPEVAGSDLCVSFCSSYEPPELSSALIASAVLAKKCNGAYWIMEDFEREADPIEMAKHIISNGL